MLTLHIWKHPFDDPVIFVVDGGQSEAELRRSHIGRWHSSNNFTMVGSRARTTLQWLAPDLRQSTMVDGGISRSCGGWSPLLNLLRNRQTIRRWFLWIHESKLSCFKCRIIFMLKLSWLYSSNNLTLMKYFFFFEGTLMKYLSILLLKS